MLIVIPVVVGSSPIGHPTVFNEKAQPSGWAFLFLALYIAQVSEALRTWCSIQPKEKSPANLR